MKENVVPLHGGPVEPQDGEPDEDIVEICEDMLRRARNGDVRCMAICYVDGTGMPCEITIAGGNARNIMVLPAAMFNALWRLSFDMQQCTRVLDRLPPENDGA